MIVAHGAMGDGNGKAIDRVVEIARELDRYSGPAAIAAALLADERQPLQALAPTRRALEPPCPASRQAGNGAAGSWNPRISGCSREAQPAAAISPRWDGLRKAARRPMAVGQAKATMIFFIFSFFRGNSTHR